MPQDGALNYYYPLGTPGIPDQTIESEAYNTFLDDLVSNDLNIPRPIHRGGTGANNATEGIANLGGEKSSQLVTNYDTQQFLPGSFYSTAAATAAPVTGHTFVGWVVSSDVPAIPIDNQNIVLFAVDQTDAGRLYTREKKAGVWGAWRGNNSLVAGVNPPVGTQDGGLWWDSDNGILYVNYNDGNTTQWVQAVAIPSIDTSNYASKNEALLKTGGVMTGNLQLAHDPTNLLDAATKQYVDATVQELNTVPLGGGKTFEIPVPATAQMARVTGIIIPTSANPIAPVLQVSLVPGVFRVATADYQMNGFVHATVTTPAAVINVVASAVTGITLTNGNANAGTALHFDGTILLKRPAAGTVFSGEFRAVVFNAGGVVHSFLHTFVQAAAGTELQVLALRIISATGDNWATGSIMKLEWM